MGESDAAESTVLNIDREALRSASCCFELWRCRKREKEAGCEVEMAAKRRWWSAERESQSAECSAQSADVPANEVGSRN